MISRTIPLPVIKVIYNIVYHCNLNCKYCKVFSPLADKWYADIDIFSKDMSRLSELFSKEAQVVTLSGGEPLLHPEINSFMHIARECFPKSLVKITTNGILLPSMNDDFWGNFK